MVTPNKIHRLKPSGSDVTITGLETSSVWPTEDQLFSIGVQKEDEIVSFPIRRDKEAMNQDLADYVLENTDEEANIT